MPAAPPRPRGPFRKAVSGAVAPLFAVLATFVLIPAVAVAIDIDRAMSARSALQDAVDAAALAVAHLPANSSQDTIESTARTWVDTNLANATMGPVTLTTTPGPQSIDITATSTSPTMLRALGSFAGLESIPISAHAVAKWGLSSVELVMVLDNSGSMDGAKLSSLKAAAATLTDALTQAVAANGGGSVKIGVAPFAGMVNIGSEYRGQPWLSGAMPSDYGPDVFTLPGVDRFVLYQKMGEPWSGCVEDRPMPYDIQDTAPSADTPATLFVPSFAPDEPDRVDTSADPTAHYANNYAFDIATDTSWTARQGNPAKYVRKPRNRNIAKGPNMSCTTAAVLRLTPDVDKVKRVLNGMAAEGDTEIPLGLVWGWHLLSPNRPFADGQPYATPNVLKVIVLVTDGENTYVTGTNYRDNSDYTGIGYIWQGRIATDTGDTTAPAKALDDRLARLCTNIKSAGIVVFTVPVAVDTVNIKRLLQGCASSSDTYIDARSPSDLQAAFAQIAQSIGTLRLTK